MAELAHVSNPYLSQLERGLHEPSVRVLQSISRALNLSAETLLAHAGVADVADDGEPADTVDTEAAIRRDPALDDDQKQALLSVYRSYVQASTADRRNRR
jgi:transcriptional regulator with XRE-family HTH domain